MREIIRDFFLSLQLKVKREPPLPSPSLRLTVAATSDADHFLNWGKWGVGDIQETLRRNNLDLNQFERILDFGCGCGRVLRHMKSQSGKLFGTDLNAEAVEYCRKNLPFARVEKNKNLPPACFENEFFDFIYSFSVFTHLDQTAQSLWLNELLRVLKPGGYLLLSLHGASFRKKFLEGENAETFDRGNLVVVNAQASGQNQCGAFHPEGYVRDHFLKGLDLLDFIPEGARTSGGQDIYLLRKR